MEFIYEAGVGDSESWGTWPSHPEAGQAVPLPCRLLSGKACEGLVSELLGSRVLGALR